MKHSHSSSLTRRTATMLRYGTTTVRRHLFAIFYATVVSLFILRAILARDGILHMSDLSYLASQKQFSGFVVWDQLAQSQLIVNHLVFDPWLAYFEPVLAQRIFLFVLFFLIPFVSFLGFRGLLARHFDRYVTVSALFGSLLYTFNPIVVVRSRHYFLVWYYAFLPLLLYYTVELSADIDSSTRPTGSLRGIIWGRSRLDGGSNLAAAPPHTTWVKIAVILFLMSGSVRMPYYFLVPLFAVVAFIAAPYGRYVWHQTRNWVAIFGLYFLLTAVWSFPYLMRAFNGSGPSPAGNRYVVTEPVLSLLSRNATLHNVIFLQSFWGNKLMTRIFGFESTTVIDVWGLSVAVLVGLTFLGVLLYIRDKREVVALSALLVVSVFLAKGTNPPFPDFYPWLVFDSPLSVIGWQFRGSTKWNLLLMFSYATLAVFAISWLFRTVTTFVAGSNTDAKREVAAVVAIGLVLSLIIATAGFPLLSGHIANDASFVNTSPNYESLLDSSTDEYKVHAFPRSPPTGTPGQRGTSSGQYYQYATTPRADTQRYLGHVNVGSAYTTRFARNNPSGGLESDTVLNISRPQEMITAHDRSTYSFTFPYLRQQPTVYGTAGIGEPIERSLRRSDIVVLNDRPPVPFLSRATVVTPISETESGNPSTAWVKASTDDPAHGRWHARIERLGIRNWQFDYDQGLVLTRASERLQDVPDSDVLDSMAQWRFQDAEDVSAWDRPTAKRQFGATQTVSGTGDELAVRLHNETPGWKKVRSPTVPVDSKGPYRVHLRIRGTNVRTPHLKVVELDEDGEFIRRERVATVGDGSFDWREVETNYLVKNASTATLRFEIWHGSKTSYPLPNELWIDEFRVSNLSEYTEPVSMDMDVSVEETTEYKVFARYFESQRGGAMTVSVDGDPVRIDSRSPENQFVWTELDTRRLTAGEHDIRLANERGFNAVNLIVLVPVDEYRRQQQQLDRLLENRTSAYVFEAEQGFEPNDRSVHVAAGARSTSGQVFLAADDAISREIQVDRAGYYTLSARGAGAFDVRLEPVGQPDDTSGDGENGTVLEDTGQMGSGSGTGSAYTFRASETTTESLTSMHLDQGRYVLTIEDASSSVDLERPVASIEFERDGTWERGSDPFRIARSEPATSGNSSLEVTTSATDQSWSWIHTRSVRVVPGHRYRVGTSAKYENVEKSHALLIGHNASTGKWERLNTTFESSDGTADWRRESRVIEIPRHIDRVKFALNGGWVLEPDQGNATTWFDDLTITRVGSDEVDAVWLADTPANMTSAPLAAGDEGAPSVADVEKLSPTKYRVQVDADDPYLLSFAEGYDPLWVAQVESDDGGVERYTPVPLYATTNGFWIEETGTHTVTVRYRPQRWFVQGAIVTGIALFASLAYLFYGWRHRRGDGWTKRVGRLVSRSRSKASGVLPWR